MSEKSSVQSPVMLAIGKLCPHVALFRNNVGFGVALSARGSLFTKILSAVVALANKMGGHASPVKYGLFEGSADLIGWETTTVTPEMVGKPVAIFLSIECKTPTGKIEPAQVTWAANVRAAGGKAIIARSVDEAVTGV
jgi:hypothetical protein